MKYLVLLGLVALQVACQDPAADEIGALDAPMDMEPMNAGEDLPQAADIPEAGEPEVETRGEEAVDDVPRREEEAVEDVPHEVSMETIDPEGADNEQQEHEQERAEAEAGQGVGQTSSPATSAPVAPASTHSHSFPPDQLWKHELLEDLLRGFPGFDFLSDWYAGILFPYTVTADLLWNVEYGCLQTWRGMAPLVWRGGSKLLMLRNGQVSRAMELQALDWLTLAHKFRENCPRKSKFYLGLATSMVLDSYAPAHVVRDQDGCGHIWQFQNYDAQDPKLHHAADKKFHRHEFPGVWKCARSAVKELLHAHQQRKTLKHFKLILKNLLRVAPHRVEEASGGSLEPFVARQWLRDHGVAHDLGATPKDILDTLDQRHYHRKSLHHLPRTHANEGIEYPKQAHPAPVIPYYPYHKRHHHRFLETVARVNQAKAKTTLLEEDAVTKVAANTDTKTADAAATTADKKFRPSSGLSSGVWSNWNWGSGWNAWNSWRGWRAPASWFRSAPVLPYPLVPRSVEIRSSLFGRRIPRFFVYDWEEPEYVADEELSIPALCVAQAGPFTADIIRTWDYDLTAKDDELNCELPLFS